MSTSGTKPLSGLRVIEFAALGPVPFAAMWLSDLGAEVIRIDRRDNPGLGIPMDNAEDCMLRGRRSIVVELKVPRGVELALQLIDSADVLMEGMRPGKMERLGLGPEVCRARNPRLIYSRMTGWGQSGPLARKAGHDINYISMNGVLHSIGLEGGPPVPPINLVGDYGGGAMFLLTGILAALHQVGSGGEGSVVDAAMVDGSSYLLSAMHMFAGLGMWSSERGTNLLDSGAPFYGVYPTSDGRHMAVGAIEPQFYSELLDGLGLDVEALPSPLDRRTWPLLKERIGAAFASRRRDEWVEVFRNRDACVTPVLTMEEAVRHEHAVERDSFVEAGNGVRPNPAPRFDGCDLTASATVPKAGEDTRQILAELGLSAGSVEKLLQQRVVAAAGDR